MIGQRLARREDERALRGQGRFVDDVKLPRMVHAAFVRSPIAHGAITAIRRPQPGGGLLAIITADDLGDRARPLPSGMLGGEERAPEPHPILARDEVRYVGQPVAAVIAESRPLAEDAAERVEVQYAPRTATVDPRRSPDRVVHWRRSGGDVARAFASARRVVRGTYGLPRLIAAPLETRGCVVEQDPGSGMLSFWCSMQDPHRPRAQLAHVLDRPEDSIRVIVGDVGGAFGSKGVIAPEIAVAAIAATELRRPVKWVEDRLENFLCAYQGRGIEGELELALDDEARMLGVRATLYADLGAYVLATTMVPPHTAAMLITGCYEIPAAEVTIVGCRTNKVPTGPYRGAGRPDAAYMIERIVDDAARELGIDRVQLRRRNLIRSFPHRTPLGLTYDSGDYERCLDLALELSPAHDAGADAKDRVTGSGVALFVERAGGQWEAAEVELLPGGELLVRSSASPHGQGHETTFAQIAAARLETGVEKVTLRFGDSAEVPRGVGTFGSRSVAMAGSAIVLAIDKLLERGRAVAAERLGVPDAEVRYSAGAFSAGGRSLSLAEVATGRELRCSGRFESDLVFSSGAYAAVVEIERSTGRLRVRRIAAVDDAGNIINPLLAHGQVIGGAVQALGECLTEEAAYDHEGAPRFCSLMDYSMLTAAEVPEICIGEVSTPSPLNPLGAKGVGEAGAIGTLAAVANAVVDALDGRHLDPPFSDEKLWWALR